MKDSIVLEREFNLPPEKIWHALTDAETLGRWLMPNTFRLEVGAEFTFSTKPAPGFDGVVRCKVLQIDPQRSLSYTWQGGGLDTDVEWTLEPKNSGTLLRLRHHGFRGFKASLIRRILEGGWKSMLSGEAFERLAREAK